MDVILLQLLNGLDKGGAYALIALGLTLVFGTLGVVNFAHGVLFMLGAFCAVTFNKLLQLGVEKAVEDTGLGFTPPPEVVPYVNIWFGDEVGVLISNFSVPLSILMVIPVMLFAGVAIERGLVRHFYKRPHADQILVTFGLAIVLQEIVKHYFGANPIPQSAPSAVSGSANIGAWLGISEALVYPWWRLIYFGFSAVVIAVVFSFLQFTTYGMVVRAGMNDRETVGILGIDIERRFTVVFGIAAIVAGLAGAMYTPTLPPDYRMGMDFLVLSFVVVVVGGMGSLPGAVLAGFLLGIMQSFAAVASYTSLVFLGAGEDVKSGALYKLLDFADTWILFPGIDQIIIYLVAVFILLTLPRGLMGRAGVMED